MEKNLVWKLCAYLRLPKEFCLLVFWEEKSQKVHANEAEMW